jgi:hypothetical protein
LATWSAWRDTPKVSHNNVRFAVPQEVVGFIPAPAFRGAAAPRRAPGGDSQLPLQQLNLNGAPRESIAQRTVLALEFPLPLRGAVAPHERGLHARQRRVAPTGHRLRPDTEAPRDLVDRSLALENLQHSVLAVLQAAAAWSPALPAVLLLALILSRHR